MNSAKHPAVRAAIKVSTRWGKRVVLVALLLSAGALGWEALETLGWGPFMINMWSSPSEAKAGGTTWHSRGALFKEFTDNYLHLRSWAPSFSIITDGPLLKPVRIEVDNVLPTAVLDAPTGVKESRVEITRFVEVPANANSMRLIWSAGPHGSFSFGVTGDIHYTTLNLKNMTQNVDFMVIAGDLVVGKDQASPLLESFQSIPVPIYSVVGNHDVEGSREKDYVHKVSPYNYSFTYGDARFIFFNNVSETAFGIVSDGMQWLETQLKSSSTPLTFLFMHRPPFHDMNDTEYKRPHAVRAKSTSMELISLAAQAGVSTVFCGHVHEYHHWQREGVAYIITGEGHQDADEKVPLFARVVVNGTKFSVLDEMAEVPPSFGGSRLSEHFNKK